MPEPREHFERLAKLIRERAYFENRLPDLRIIYRKDFD